MLVWELNAVGIDNLKLVEKPDPKPGPGQIVVGMKAASLNYRDLLHVTMGGTPLPLIPFSDGAGVVEQLLLVSHKLPRFLQRLIQIGVEDVDVDTLDDRPHARRSGDEIALYVDGELAATEAAGPADVSTGALAVGRAKWSGGNTDFRNGAVDQVRVYDKALTGKEVTALYNGDKP